ncbi:MAG: DUF2264 domain-containing protein [Lachnospiraceae bacterium]|nr:DUF2264 domain-containing protein [Lachnospiraceae bacterium]
MTFIPSTTDYSLSPYTGLTRQSWIEAGEYLLTGIFKHIQTFEDPVVMPRKETAITYPHLSAPEDVQEAERKAEMFEGLTRTMFIAAPLIHDNPEITICGYKLADYYKNQILRSVTPSDPIYVGTYEQLQEITGNKDPFRCFQQTVETCALVICLWMSKEEIWDTYAKEEKDRIAGFLSSFGHNNTVPQNWRLFNMLDLAFLYREGYEIREDIMLDHAQSILAYYVGDGWYRDGQCFDYYSCWAFNVYAPLWNLWYGYDHMPRIAEAFEEHSNELMKTYAEFFDEDGFTNMFGRSNIYRNAATSAFDGNMFLRHWTADPGLARRISSGSLMQFLGRDDTLWNGIPTLGFYGQFSPLVQGYSCAESPFWLGKAFLCLHLPADHPFWTAKENNGIWEILAPRDVKKTVLNGPALCFTNHKANGETILRTGKVVKNIGDLHGMWNYSKLCFNTRYPWEAMPEFSATENAGGSIQKGELESQQYLLKDVTTGAVSHGNATFWAGERDNVLYRRQFFDYRLDTETHWIQAVNLADTYVPCGILRFDKHRLHRRPVEFTLGSYGFPDNGTEVTIKETEGAKAIIFKGTSHTGECKQLAMTVYGDVELGYVKSKDTNPDSEHSLIAYAKWTFKEQYGGHEPYLMISQTITRESHEDFTEDELFPILRMEYTDPEKTGAFGPIKSVLKDGTTRIIDFDQIEARLSL